MMLRIHYIYIYRGFLKPVYFGNHHTSEKPILLLSFENTYFFLIALNLLPLPDQHTSAAVTELALTAPDSPLPAHSLIY